MVPSRALDPRLRTHRTDAPASLASKLASGVALTVQAASSWAAGGATEAAVVSEDVARRAAALEADKDALDPHALAARRRELYRALSAPASAAPSAAAPALGAVASAVRAALDSGADALTDVDLPVFVYGAQGLGVGVRVSEKVLGADDPLISKHSARRAHLAAAEARGAPQRYVLVGGGLFPRAGVGASAPVGGVGYVTAGFAANAGLRFSLLAPYAAEPQAALELARDATTRLPLDADAARTWARERPGGALTLAGRGAIAGYVGAGVGQRLLDLGGVASLSATAGVDVAVSKQAGIELRLDAVDADHVRVTLSEVRGQGAHAAVGAHVGLLDGATREASALERWVLRDVDRATGGQLEDELALLDVVDFRASHTAASRDTEVASYLFDLRVPAARAAFDDVVRLDLRRADAAVATGATGGAGGVTRAAQREAATLSKTAVTLEVGPLELLSSIAERSARHGTVTAGDRVLRYDRADLSASFSSLFTRWAIGDQRTVRELISVRDSARPAPESHLHLASTVSGDGVTSAADVRSWLRLATALGALSPEARDAKLADPAFLEQFEETDRRVDVFIADAGLARVAKASARDVLAAYGAAYEELERPGDIHYLVGGDAGVWKTTPWLATDHPSHAQVMALIKSELARRDGKSHHGDESTYRAITGRSLGRDAAAYRDARRLADVVGKLGRAPDAAARAQVFAREADDGLALGRELVALAKLAGPGAVQVRELSLVDLRADGPRMVLGGAAAIADPDEAVDALLGRTSP